MKLDNTISLSHSIESDVFLSLLQPLLKGDEFEPAAVEFLSRLVQTFQYDRASVGFVFGKTIRIAAVSGYHQEIKPAMLPELAVAMQESILQDATLTYPHPPSDFPYIVLAHANLAQEHGLSNVLTVPFGQDGRMVGAITLENRRGGDIDPAELAVLMQLVNHAGALLDLKWSLQQPFVSRVLQGVKSYVMTRDRKTVSRIRIVFVAAAVAGVLLLFLVPVSTQVAGQARLEASVQRILSAPVDGYLKEVRVRPGDRVQEQQVLAELNDENLRTEQRRLEAEARQHENALAEAMAKADRVEVVLRIAKLDEVVAQRDLVKQQLELIRLTAPFEGVVIKGDLTQLLGSPIKRGDVLLTLSEGSGFRVMVEVPERDIQDMQVGQRGHLVLSALPSMDFSIHVARITPVATVSSDGQNVFEIEAVLDADASKLLVPGLKGVAKIAVHDKPLGWKWAARAWDALSFIIWSRLP